MKGNYMRSYIKDNLHLITHQLLNQFGSAIMGLILSAAVGMSSNKWLILGTTIFTIMFYMVVQYTSLWDAGARDNIRVEGNRLPYRPYAGLVMSVFSAIPNFIIGILVVVGTVFSSTSGAFGFEWAGNMCAIVKGIALFWESMYNGIIQLYSPNNPWIYMLIPIPAMLAAGLGYFAGMKNFQIIRVKKKSKTK